MKNFDVTKGMPVERVKPLALLATTKMCGAGERVVDEISSSEIEPKSKALWRRELLVRYANRLLECSEKIFEDSRLFLTPVPINGTTPLGAVIDWWQNYKCSWAEDSSGKHFPVYGWDVPPIVKKFIRNLRIDENSPKYIFMVCTCGDDIGHTDKRFFRLLKEKGWECHAAWSVLMPDTYIGLPGFEIDSEKEINQKLSAACQQTQQIAQSIIKREKNIRNLKNGKFAWTKTHILGWAFYHWLTGDHKFHTKSNCTHCGKCAKVCPLNNITYTTEGFPKWNGHCSDCLACYHHCPQRAIEYRIKIFYSPLNF